MKHFAKTLKRLLPLAEAIFPKHTIRIVENDQRRFAAQFERHAFQTRNSGLLRNQPADFGAAGEADFVHVWMCTQGTTGSRTIT